jgi:hypothetical protein
LTVVSATEVAMMFVVPNPIAVTSPVVALTVATAAVPVVHLTLRFV